MAGAERIKNVHKYQARSLKYVQEMERLGLLKWLITAARLNYAPHAAGVSTSKLRQR